MTGLLQSGSFDTAEGAKAEERQPEGEPAPPRRRRKLRRMLLGLNIALAIAVLGAGGAYGYVSWKLGKIDKINIPGEDSEDPNKVALVGEQRGKPFNVLLVGSDSRAFVSSKEDRRSFGSEALVGGTRSDVMMVVRIDPAAKRASVLSIPRDLWVTLDGGGKGRMNEAFGDPKESKKSNPGRLIRTIKQNLGISVNHYMEVDFAAFRRAVDAVGGIDLYFPTAARDTHSGLDIKGEGCAHLDGQAGLAYVRSRHYQYRNKDGRWVDEPTGDLGRIERQHQFIRVLLRKVKAQATNPLALNRLVDAGVENLKTDDGFSRADMLRTARALSAGNPEDVQYLSIPTASFTTEGGADVLRVVQPETDAVLTAFGSQPLAAASTRVVAPQQIPVTILNATTTAGLAAKVQADLVGAGFPASVSGNAPSARSSTIRFPKGADARAKVLQQAIEGTVSVRQDNSLDVGSPLVLSIGSAWKGVKGAAVTTTTAGRTTSSVAPPTTAAPKGSDFSRSC